LFENLKSRCEAGEDSVVATLLSADGKIVSKRLVEDSTRIDGLAEGWNMPGANVGLPEELRKSFHRHETRRLKFGNDELILEPVAGIPSLIIFGAGHVSRFVSQGAALSGFRVTVVDDRAEYANAKRFPEAAETLAMEFEKAFSVLSIRPASYIVIVTRGHQYDEEILERALQTSARYIGMIGSKRKVLTTFEHLAGHGVSADQLNRVHAPMGLDIAAVTAEEISISVVAELIAVRRRMEGAVLHKSDAMKQLRRRLSETMSGTSTGEQ
jgi:xanthine dehydrogenase accessory factor